MLTINSTPIPARGTARFPADARVINRNSPYFPASTVTHAWPASSDGRMVESVTASGGRSICRSICHSDHLIVVPAGWEDAPWPPMSELAKVEAAYDGPIPREWLVQALEYDRSPARAPTWLAFHRRYLAWVLQHLLPLGWDEFQPYRVAAMAAVTAAQVRVGKARVAAAAAPVGRE